MLNGLLGLGLTIPAVDSRRSAVADSVKEDILRKTGAVVIDTIEGLAVIADDPKHFEQVMQERRVSIQASLLICLGP